MSNKGMPDGIKKTWGIILKWREENGDRWPRPADIAPLRDDLSIGRLQDHFAYLRRHRFMGDDKVSYQEAKHKRNKQSKQYTELMAIARELRNKGFG